jgi:U3 small nucleolar RNA-associated protein 10
MMVSSLESQLAQGSSLNAVLLADPSRRASTESYLLTGREADHHDLDSIHALAASAFLQLRQLNAAFGSYENSLFSDTAKGVDRTLLSREAVTALNKDLAEFLPLLGPYLMEIPTGKVLEWLVRRFRYVPCFYFK